MKRLVRRIFRVFLVLLVLAGLLIIFIMKPQLLYARERAYKTVYIYSNNISPAGFDSVLNKSIELISHSEIYDSLFRFDLFLNDGSSFPAIPKKLLGDAFAWGYHNNVVLNGKTDPSLQFIHYNGYQRQLARTIAHEMIHCLEANRFGLFGSRPLKKIPHWKWEGYPEYIAYRSSLYNEDSMFISNLKLLHSLKNETYCPVEVNTDEGKSIAGLDYFRWWLMIKYCLDIKKMTFIQIMKEEISDDSVYKEMMRWYADYRKSFSPPSGP
ncbi:MAG: hypothetical protein ABUT20_45605 [Bacteroidota bacterium]